MNFGRFALATVLATAALSPRVAIAQAEPEKPKPAPFSIVVTGEIDADLAPVVGKLTQLFFESYPKLVERFENPKKPAPRQVRMVLARGLKVPAYCSGAEIKVSVEWLQKHPEDIGLLTHELTHAVQAYPRFDPSWLVEGLADYARKLYGPKDQPNWSLPPRLTKKQSYKDSYRTTAAFLVWLDGKHPGAVDKLHRRLQDKEFAVTDFEKITGTSLDDLWDECVSSLGKKQ